MYRGGTPPKYMYGVELEFNKLDLVKEGIPGVLEPNDVQGTLRWLVPRMDAQLYSYCAILGSHSTSHLLSLIRKRIAHTAHKGLIHLPFGVLCPQLSA